MIHPESEARGDALQVIPGIPYFYRQFGYEYSLCSYPAFAFESTSLHRLSEDLVEPFTLRRATLSDIPLLLQLSSPANRHANAMIGQHYTQEYWQYTVHDVYEVKTNRFDADRETSIIVETETGKVIGFTVMSSRFLGPTLLAMGVAEGVEVGEELAHSVLRQLIQWAKERLEQDAKNSAEAMKAKEEAVAVTSAADAAAAATATATATVVATEAPIEDVIASILVEERNSVDPTDTNAASAPETTATASDVAAPAAKDLPFPIELALHEQHPLILQLRPKATRPTKIQSPGMRLYTRIASYPHFLLSVAKELESRLAQSSTFAKLSGIVRLDFFRRVENTSGGKGLELVFEDGILKSAQDWVRPSPEGGLEERKFWKKEGKSPRIFFASFPPMLFTSLMTGHQDFDDLYLMYGDVQLRNEESRELLKVLFPKGDHYFDLFCW